MRVIIIPTMNEEKSIADTLKQLRGETVFLVDKSTDRTAAIAESLGATVIEGKGYGAAILKAFRMIEADQYIVMDCESHSFREIVPFLDRRADIIAGRRIKENKPLVRKLISGIAHLCVCAPIRDVTNGFRAYSKEFVAYILKHDLAQAPNYAFNASLAVLSRGWKVFEFPMSYKGGQSGLKPKDIFKSARWIMRFRPLPR